MPSTTCRGGLILVTLLLAACQTAREPADTDLTSAGPCVTLDTTELAFGTVAVDDTERRQVGLRNDCGGALVILNLQILGEHSDEFEIMGRTRTSITLGDTGVIDVEFRPATDGPLRATVVGTTNSVTDPRFEVALSGRGVDSDTDPPTPDASIEVSAETADMAPLHIGCTRSVAFTIENRGVDDLTVTEVLPFTASVEEFRVDLDPLTNGPLPWTLAPYDEARGGPRITFWVEYTPLDTFQDDAYIAVNSDDPLLPESVHTLSGTGVKFRDSLDQLTATGSAFFTLGTRPVPQTLEVTVQGVRIREGWAYDVTTNSVVFDEGAIPDVGQQVEISYEDFPTDCPE